ncbi:MAG TPA: tetratricopeptide repeat protein [Hyphomicrobiales bacterium]|nr:tetratricopeptide repeat protein [Hyphomicrobiales bacterium]
MIEQGNAKAGRAGAGSYDFENAPQGGNNFAFAERDDLNEGDHVAAGSESPFSIFGQGQSEAEAYLFAYLEKVKAGNQKAFAPYAELSARLDELGAASQPEAQISPAPADAVEALPSPPGDHIWFDRKFEELRGRLREDAKQEIMALDAKLEDIANRVDKLSLAAPGEKTLAAVKSQLSELSWSLAVTRERGEADADKVSLAAKEVMAAANIAKEASARFELTARHAVKELGQTVAVTASRTATRTAAQFASAVASHRSSDIARLEDELRALQNHSQESSRKTEASLERVHKTLESYLERTRHAKPYDEGPRRPRAGVHMPIGADGSVYTGRKGFGSEPAPRPQLESITRRRGPELATDLSRQSHEADYLQALREAGEHLQATRRQKPLCDSGDDDALPHSPFRHEETSLRHEERTLPLLGVGIVAIALLLASAALYYLHTKSSLVPFHLTVVPQIQSSLLEHSSPETEQRADPQGGTNSFPALLSSAEQRNTPGGTETAKRDELQSLTSAASRGDKEAQFRIGSRFLNGYGLESDPYTAARWLERAAEQNHTEAQFVLASLYERGVGVPKNDAYAIAWYRKAAKSGHIRAMHNLGVMLAARAMQKDYEEAASWFMQAASAGLSDSQFNLALLYERGLGLEADRERAFFWYEVAARAGDKEAMQRAEALKREMSPLETQTVADRANSWRPSIEDTRQKSGQS